MQAVKNVVIAAAGMGTRLGMGMPKCLIEIEKVSVIRRLLGQLPDGVNIVVVVGYREELVIEEIRNINKKVIISRNTQYRSNSAYDSFSIGSKHVEGKTIFMDGDLVLSNKSFNTFIKEAASCEILVAITRQKTEHPVYAHILKENNISNIVEFSRNKKAEYEWCNVFSAKADYFQSEEEWVYKSLEKNLPVQCLNIDCFEVDTPSDLDNAKKFLMSQT